MEIEESQNPTKKRIKRIIRSKKGKNQKLKNQKEQRNIKQN